MKKTAFILMMALAVTAFAQRGPAPRNAECLYPELTEAQQEQLHDLKVEHDKKMIPLRADLKVLQLELREMMTDGENEKAVLKKNSEINDVRAKISDLNIRHKLEIRDAVGTDVFKKMGAARRPVPGQMDRNRRDNGRRNMRMNNDPRERRIERRIIMKKLNDDTEIETEIIDD